MNPQSVHLLQRHVSSEASSCQFKVTDDRSSGIILLYKPTAALTCVTKLGEPLPCQTQCSLYQDEQQVMGYIIVSMSNTMFYVPG